MMQPTAKRCQFTKSIDLNKQPFMFGRSRSHPPRRLGVLCAHVQAPAVELSVKSLKGQEPGKDELKLRVADAGTAKGLVHRHVLMIQQNARQGSASTKTRAEVRGGGKKPLQQKGTGNARQGSRRTPLKPGGGVVFGPKPVDWSIKMNKKEKRLAIATALHSAAKSMTVVDEFTAKVTDMRTKVLLGAFADLGLDLGKQHVLMIVDELTDAIQRSGRNVEKLVMTTASKLNSYDILRADHIVVDQASLQFINEFYG